MYADTMPFAYRRTIRFADTDAAGGVFFPNYLAICHEAYEESLTAAGLELHRFFADTGVVVPIARSEADYLRPLKCGDQVRVDLTVVKHSEHGYTLDFALHRLGRPDKLAARVRTEHVCISVRTRERQPLPAKLAAWIKAQSA